MPEADGFSQGVLSGDRHEGVTFEEHSSYARYSQLQDASKAMGLSIGVGVWIPPYENPATKPYLFLDAQSSQGNELSSSFMTMELSFRAGI